jgi:hypothetical protein
MPIAERAIERLRAGRRLTVQEFLRRLEAMTDVKFAELIDGVVFMPSPQTKDHGRAEIRIDTWLGTYMGQWHTPQSRNRAMLFRNVPLFPKAIA